MASALNIQELTNELVITINQTKRSQIPTIIFLLVWLCGWAFGEVFAITVLIGGDTPWFIDLFLLVWVAFWTVGGGFAILSVLRMIGGRETIRVGRGMIRIKRSLLVFKMIRRYDIFRISDLHSLSKNPRKFAFANSGLIQFSYEGKMILFGMGLTRPEKDQIMEKLREHRDFSDRNFR